MMRLLGGLMIGLSWLVPAQALGQGVKRADLVGRWEGKANYTGAESKARGPLTRTLRMMLWSDGLFMYLEGGEVPNFAHAAGRWKLVGDTLWWGADYRYGDNFGMYTRDELPPEKTRDSLEMPGFPRNDSLFWTAPFDKRPGMPKHGYWWYTPYKVTLKGKELTMVRIDKLSSTEWSPANAVLTFIGQENEPASRPAAPAKP